MSPWKNAVQLGFLLLGAVLAFRSQAEPDALPSARNQEQTWSGTFSAVDTRNHVLNAEAWWFPKDFMLSQNCTVTVMGKSKGTFRDLRPGDRLQVTYEDVHGTAVADHVRDQSRHFLGTVQAVDPDTGRLTIQQGRHVMSFQVGEDCEVLAPDGLVSSLYDLGPGDKVALTCDASSGTLTPSRVRKVNLSYQGALQAIDLTEHIVKVANPLGQEEFSVTDHCQIVVAPNKTARLKDLKLDQKCTVSYEKVNGVNVADQITQLPGSGMADLALGD